MWRLSGGLLVPVVLMSVFVTDTVAQSGDAVRLIERLGLRESDEPMRKRAGWAPPDRIVISGRPELVAALQAVAPDADVINVDSFRDVVPAIRGADIYFGFCSSDVLEAGTDIRWIQLPTAGIESCSRLPVVAERGIVVTNAQHIFGPPIAETVIGMVLSFAKQLPRYFAAQQQGVWSVRSQGDRLNSGMWELEGKTLLVVGLGGLGTEVARRASALGMRVIATRNSSREGPDFVDYVGLAHEVGELARQADVVVNTTPLTDDTRGMFNRSFFEQMQSTAYFINVGRGQSVITEDLVEALQSNTIAGAGLDVTDPEPLPDGHPLWGMENVIIVPHVAGYSDRITPRLHTLFVENVRRYVAGEALLSVVDLERGY